MTVAISTTSTVQTTNATETTFTLVATSAFSSLAQSLSNWRPIAMRKDSKGLENEENSLILAFTREFLSRPKNMADIALDRRQVEVPTMTPPKNQFEIEELTRINTQLLFDQVPRLSEGRIAPEKLRQADQAEQDSKNGSGLYQSTADTSKAMMEYLNSIDDSPAKKTKIDIKTPEISNNTKRKYVSPKEALLRWCQIKTMTYPISVTNFSGSWADGMAFCALVHHFCPTAFDFAKLRPQDRRHNFELAFQIAEQHGICRLLEVEDMILMGDRPDWKCVFTYVQAIYRRFRNES